MNMFLLHLLVVLIGLVTSFSSQVEAGRFSSSGRDKGSHTLVQRSRSRFHGGGGPHGFQRVKRSNTTTSSVSVAATTKTTITKVLGPGLQGILNINNNPSWIPKAPNCFPALGFEMPQQVPQTVNGWWCSIQDVYGFMGFSYSVSACPSMQQMAADFKRQRYEFNARYVRIYSVCDRPGFYDDIINAAWEAGVGVHLLLWFGWDKPDAYKARAIEMTKTMLSNSKAPFVVSAFVVGSEPLYDWALEADQLADLIVEFQHTFSAYTFIGVGTTGMMVTLSDLAYGFQLHGNAPNVFAAVNISEANVLPFLDPSATTANQMTQSFIRHEYDYFAQHNQGKKVIFSQTGWPSNDNVWKANSPNTIASVQQQQDYFNQLDQACEWMKTLNQGGLGWFAHMWDDSQLPGWGIIQDGHPKFDFHPRTEC